MPPICATAWGGRHRGWSRVRTSPTAGSPRWPVASHASATPIANSSSSSCNACRSTTEHSAGRQLPEGQGLVRTRLGRQAEHPLTEHVALHLLGAAADPDPPLTEELLLPQPVLGRVRADEHPRRTLDRERQITVARDVVRHGELEDRALRTGRLSSTYRGLRSRAEVLEDLESDERVREPLTNDRIIGTPVLARETRVGAAGDTR